MDVTVSSFDVNSSSMQQDQSISHAMKSDALSKDQSQIKSDEQDKHLTKKQVQQLVDEANRALQPDVTELKYVYFDKLQSYYVQVQDVNTHQVIREIPPKKFLEMYASVAEKLGLIVNDKA